MCSLIPTPSLKRRGQPYFLGSPLPDTVPAGSGMTRSSSSHEGHFGRSKSHPIYGQFVRVSRTGGAGLGADVRSLDTVVVVPWDYDPACKPIPWSRTSAWLPPRGVQFFSVRLRDRANWYQQYPTFDAFAPENAAYPGAYASPVFGPLQPSLTPQQLFDFFEAMPAIEDVGMPHALENARAWTEQHRDVSDSYPTRAIVVELLTAASADRARRIGLPMAGTYRLELTLPNGHVRVLYARTVDRSTEPHYDERETTTAGPPGLWEDPSVGFELWFFTAAVTENLPTTWGEFDQRMRAEWPWYIAWGPESTSTGVRWPASIEPWQFKPSHPGEPVMDSLFAHHDKWFHERWDAGTLPLWYGWFTLGPGDAVHFEEPIPLGDAGTLLVRGVRISTATVSDSLR
jgi:hypothetical protein